jgi:hypothetical protein
MKVRSLFVLALILVFAVSAFSGGKSCDKSKAKDQSKSCCVEQTKAKSDQCTDSKMKASDKMDCCKKELKETKASNAKSSKKDVAKVVKDTK